MITQPALGLDVDKIRRLLRSEDSRTLVERLQQRWREEYNTVRSSRELIEIGRAQGKLEIIDWILKLREE